MQLKFSENLVKYRKKSGLTQSQLASKLAVTPQAVSKWEKGSYPDCSILPKISEILGVSLDVLFGLKDEENKVNLSQQILSEMRKAPDSEKSRLAMEVFYSVICSYNPNTADEHTGIPESFKHETFAHLRTDHELAVSRLNEDMQYFCFLRIPPCGIDSYFSINQRILEFFGLLADENALKIICYAETLSRNYVITKECISNELSIPIEIVSDIVDRFERFGITWKLTANTGKEPFSVYGYVHNIPLVSILTLAESLINFIAYREPDIDIWTEAPFRNKKSEENNNV